MTRALPWHALMAAGLGRLRLAPACFWAMTPREFLAALGHGATTGAAPIRRETLQALMAAYPDHEGSQR